LVYAWGLGVVLPHLFAVTKTPSATVLAMPALFLLLGCLVAEAWRGGFWPLAALTAVLSLSVLSPAVVKGPGHGYPDAPGFGGVMWQASWVLDHVLGAAALVGHLAIARVIVRAFLARNDASLGRYVRGSALLFCSAALGWLGWQTVAAAWDVTRANVNDP